MQGGLVLTVATPALLTILNSPTDILVIVLVFLVLFGGKKIPELAKGLGQGIRNFKGAMKSDRDTTTGTKEENNKLE